MTSSKATAPFCRGYYSSVAEAQHGNDVLDGGAGIDTLIGGGKDDGLFTGTGNDTLYGDHATEADLGGAYHGNDYIDGGDGDVPWWKFNHPTTQPVRVREHRGA
jgi:Ca2+-binding RTX toxin-like protein